jgi:hypothetical protein
MKMWTSKGLMKHKKINNRLCDYRSVIDGDAITYRMTVDWKKVFEDDECLADHKVLELFVYFANQELSDYDDED